MSASMNDTSYASDVPGYKRETKHRVFVNRSLQLNKIKYFGFDMDYTLAQYKSPEFEGLAFNLLREKLIEYGYPEELGKLNYEPSFPVRGMWFDKHHGTLLKMDQFGNILVCLRGFKIIQRETLRKMYPNKFLKYDEKRIVIMNTLFELPKLYMLACAIHVLTSSDDYQQVESGLKRGTFLMSYSSIYEDVHNANEWMHMGELKKRTVENLDEYVVINQDMITLLERLKSHGAKTFLLTNSDYNYSDKIMSFITSLPDSSGKIRDWTEYFDYIVTDARKPTFFKEGTILRSVNKETGRVSIGHHLGPLESGQIYSGGNCQSFSQLIGARGKDVLFVGDHIFGDILKSKKTVGWRTFLVIPELVNEIYVWKTKKELFDKLQSLDNRLANKYKNMDISSINAPDVGEVQAEIRRVAQEMEESYGILGSIFRNGSRHTFFSSQALRYADLYSFSCANLIYYPLSYMFRAPQMLMPHESTVSHSDTPQDSFVRLDNAPCGLQRRSRADSMKVPCNVEQRMAVTTSDDYIFKSTGHLSKEFDDDDEEETDEEVEEDAVRAGSVDSHLKEEAEMSE